MSRKVDNPYINGRGPKPTPLGDKLTRSSARDIESWCLVWTAGKDKDGYGKVWHEGRTMPAHRASWLLTYGELPIPPLRVLHHCDNTSCIEVTHLYAGTQYDNMQDRLRRGRWRGGRPPKNGR